MYMYLYIYIFTLLYIFIRDTYSKGFCPEGRKQYSNARQCDFSMRRRLDSQSQ